MLMSFITRLNNKKIVRFITRVVYHLSINVDFPSPLSPATMRVNSNPARLINSSLMSVVSCLTFFHRLSVHLVGQVCKANIAVLLLKWSSVITRPEWKSNKLLPGQLPSSSRKSSTSHNSANFDCKAKLVDKKACLIESSKVIFE